MSARAVWPAALLLAAAATAREVVRLGYFTEAQPFEVACARGWFEGDLDVEVVRLAETRTQKHRRANLPRRTSAFSSRHDDNV